MDWSSGDSRNKYSKSKQIDKWKQQEITQEQLLLSRL